MLVLHRLVPPRASLAAGRGRGARRAAAACRASRARRRATGCAVSYVPYVSPPRERSLRRVGRVGGARAGAGAARLRRAFPFDLVHAHNAVPAGDAVRRARAARDARAARRLGARRRRAVHGARACRPAARRSRRALGAARLVLANSAGHRRAGRAHGARRDARRAPGHRRARRRARPPRQAARRRSSRSPTWSRASATPTCCARSPCCAPRHPTLRYAIVGDGPERAALEALATRLEVADRVDFLGQLAPGAGARARARACTLFVMPSTEEAFGVAYVEAMAGGVPAIGCRGEPGPEEIAAAGDGFVLVPPGDIERLTQRIDELLSDPHRLREARPAGARDGRRELHLGALRRADARRLRATRCGEAACCSSPATCPPTAWARSRACTSARASSWRCSAAATQHGGAGSSGELPVPHRRVRPRELLALAASGATARSSARPAGASRCSATWARRAPRAALPLILWASLWAHPRSAAHALSYLPLRRLYRTRRRRRHLRPARQRLRARARRAQRASSRRSRSTTSSGARRRRGAPSEPAWPANAETRFLFVGRDAPREGPRGAARGLARWPSCRRRPTRSCSSGWAPSGAAFARGPAARGRRGIVSLDALAPAALRNIYAAADVLVVPSIATRTFREPWGLVVNEAMNRGLPVIASDAVGAAAGGLVRDGATA